MSSGEEDVPNEGEGAQNESVGQELKKRRIQRACDICRRKKSTPFFSFWVLFSLNRNLQISPSRNYFCDLFFLPHRLDPGCVLMNVFRFIYPVYRLRAKNYVSGLLLPHPSQLEKPYAHYLSDLD